MNNLFTINPAVMNNLLHQSGAVPSLANVIIRPGRSDDGDLILEMHQRLSDDSLYKRYHIPRRPTRQEIAKMCRLGGENGRLLVAAIPGRSPMIIGMAYYILGSEAAADTAFLVEDRFQGLGIGKRLLKALKQQAVGQGVQFFDAHVLPSNRPMIHLLRQSGQLVTNTVSYGACEIRVRL